jgi:RNA polymerase sigma factor (sigma-70 family)
MSVMGQKSASITVRYLNALLAEQEPDPELLRRFLVRREEAAFETLVRRHGPMVLALCRRLLHHVQDAEDAFQATFLVLARKAASINRREALPSWLYGVATRIASKLRRSARHSSEPLPDVPRETDADDIGWRELSAILDDELARLPERLRAPLILCFLEGRTQDEAARQLGWSKSTLRRRLEGGRIRLRASLGRRGLTLSAALVSLMLVPESARSAVPAGLAAAVVRAAGPDAAGAVSAPVLALAETALRTAPVRLARVAAVMLLAVGLAGAGQMLAGAGSGAGDQPSEQASLSPGTDVPDAPIANGPDAPGPEPEPAPDSPELAPAPLVVVKDLADEPPPQPDLAGDPLPAGARARLGTFGLRHRTVPVVSVAFAWDGRVLVFASRDGRVSFWEAATGKPFGKFQDHEGPVALSPDGRFVASASEGLRLHDLRTKSVLFRLSDAKEPLKALTFAPDGKSVAAVSADGTLCVWSTATGAQVGQVDGEKLERIALAPGSRLVAACGNKGPVCLWDLALGKAVRHYGGSDDSFGRLLISADGKHLVALAGDKVLRVWEVATGRPVREWQAGPAADSLAISADGQTVAAGNMLWDMGTGRASGQVAQEAGALSFSPDGSLLATADGARVRLWDVARRRELFRFSGHSGGIRTIAVSRDGRVALTVGSDGAKLWDTATGHERPLPAPRAGSIAAAGLTAAGTARLFGMDADAVWCWDCAAGKELARLPFDRPELLAATLDGRLALVAGDRAFPTVWEPATGKRRVLRGLIDHGVERVALSDDGRYVAAEQFYSNPKGAVRVWDLSINGEVAPLKLKHNMNKGAALALSVDGQTLAAVGDSVRIWDIAGQTDRTVEWSRWRQGDPLPYLAAAFSPSGRLLATAEYDGTVHLWEVASGGRVCFFRGHGIQAVTAIVFSADGRTLISGGRDCTAVVWDVNSLGESKDDNPKPAALEELATDLASGNAGRAYRAVIGLAAAPEQAVPVLEKALRPAAPPTEAQLRRLIATLDADTFAERERAMAELRRLGKAAEAALRQTLADKPSLELQQRVEGLLRQLEEPGPTREFIRDVRAIETLERIGTPEAQRLLQKFVEATDPRLGREAKASLERLNRRRD